jgi:chromosome partitioning protein
MYVLVLASQKGGSGKTTLSGHLAVEAEHAGVGPVALIDCDPQGSLSEWWNSRSAPTPHFVKVGLLELNDALAQLNQAGFRLAVIDTPPAITSSISRVVAHADLVIVPTRPSPHDLRAVAATVDIAERHEKPLIFVVNGATPRARITGEAAVALSQHGTVAPVIVHHRVDFAASMVDGRSVGEVVPKSQSAKEVRELWTYVQDRLARLAKDPTLTPEFRPRHLDLGPLAAIEDADLAAAAPEAPPPAEPAREPAMANHNALDMPPVERGWDGNERRFGGDRRSAQAPPFGAPDKRVHVFGRRHTDRPAEH